MKIIGLTLGLLVPLLVCSSPINDESQASDIHIFLDERGALVDEEIRMDKENDIMVVNVPAHHDIIESKTVYDMKSTWMMQALPILKECHYMRRPAALNDVNFDDVRNIATSSKEKPLKVGVLNTIKLETSAMIGPKRNRSILPESFQPHCPQDFDVRSTHMYEIGKEDFYGWESDEIQIRSQEDFFDNAAPTLIENHTRRKRALECKMFGHAATECNEVIEARCGPSGQCPLGNIFYSCTKVFLGSLGLTNCNYLAVPCAAAKARGVQINADDMAYCLLHMTTTNDHCNACCADEKCRDGGSIDFCG